MTNFETDPLFLSAPEPLSPQQREEVREYIRKHPELRQIVQDLIKAVVTAKPEKPLDFARDYFQNLP
jgi:hypothetical protein